MAPEKHWRNTVFPGSGPETLPENHAVLSPATPGTLSVACSSLFEAGDLPLEQTSFPLEAGKLSSETKTANGRQDRNPRFKRNGVAYQIDHAPRPTYHEFMVSDQAGLANMACQGDPEAELVAIKRIKCINTSVKQLAKPFTSANVVSIIDMYIDDNDLLIIYEPMDISLRRVTSIFDRPWKHFQISAVIKELVLGLSYIHENFSLYHGALSCSTVMVKLDGSVKIANIGESFARNRQLTINSKSKDIRAIGFVMIELMEPDTYILDPQSTELQRPDEWDSAGGIKDFLRATQDHSLKDLSVKQA